MPTEPTADQSFEAISTSESEVKSKTTLSPDLKKKLIPVIAAAGVVLLVLIIVMALFGSRVNRPTAKPTPTPALEPTPSEEVILSPSVYATDSAVLKIGQDLKTLDENLTNTDLKEADLMPPAINLDVNFK